MSLETIRAGFVAGMLLLGFVFAPHAASAACQFQQGVGQGNFGWDCSAGGSNAPARPRQSHFGAIAVSPSSLEYGEAYSYDTQGEAHRDAFRFCASEGRRDCKLVATVQNGCMALATSERGQSWGANTSRGRAAARQGALDACRNGGGLSCAIQVDRCM